MVLIFGAGIAQVSTLLLTPVVTRIFSPAEYGVFALLLSFSSIFIPMSTAKFEKAILIPESEDDALLVFWLCIITCFFVSGLVFTGLLIFHSFLLRIPNLETLGSWVYVAPLFIFLSGSLEALLHFRMREKRFKMVATTNTLRTISDSSLQIILGTLSAGISSLVFSRLTSFILGFFSAKFFNFSNLRLINMKDLKSTMVKHKNFPLYALPSAFVFSFSNEMTVFAISSLFSMAILGQFVLVRKVLVKPSALVGNSVKNVFYQRATEIRDDREVVLKLVYKTALSLFAIAIPILAILVYFGEDLFAFVFSEEWRSAGKYASILSPFFLTRFFSSPMACVAHIYSKQNWMLYWQILGMLVTIILFFITYKLNLDENQFFKLYSTVLSIYSLTILLVVRRIVLKD